MNPAPSTPSKIKQEMKWMPPVLCRDIVMNATCTACCALCVPSAQGYNYTEVRL